MHETAGTTFSTIAIGGKQYTLRPFTVGVYAAMEAYIVSRRTDPFVGAVRACKVAPPEQHAAIWDAATRAFQQSQTVTAEEMRNFENSLEGIAWKFWRCIMKDHPDINSTAKAMELIEIAGAERLAEIQARVYAGSGEASLKNSAGQTEAKEVTEAAPPAGK